jgi:hypothetical protein
LSSSWFFALAALFSLAVAMAVLLDSGQSPVDVLFNSNARKREEDLGPPHRVDHGPVDGALAEVQ